MMVSQREVGSWADDDRGHVHPVWRNEWGFLVIVDVSDQPPQGEIWRRLQIARELFVDAIGLD